MSQPLPSKTTPAVSATPFNILAMSPAVPPKPSPSQDVPKASDDGDDFGLPKLRLEIRDVAHPGAKIFLSAINTTDALTAAIRQLLRLLYASPSMPTTTVPPTRSVTLVLRDMPGVAYTTGSDLDSDHKEIHFSLSYIANISPDRHAHEITGVLTHELVHCYQHNAQGTCPGGLIEGVADWVRLRCELVPPHWKREAEGAWDGGYQHTAYFLDYLEARFGPGTVRRLNEKLRLRRYEEKPFWTELVGRPVEQLWKDYGEKLKDDEAVVVSKEDLSGAENETGSKAGES